MWILNKDTTHPILDDEQFITNNVQYPGNYPKDSIQGMQQVVESEAPDHAKNRDISWSIKIVKGVPTRVYSCTPLTAAELAANQEATRVAGVKTRIVDLEAQITNRRLREAILGVDGGWLAKQEVTIKTLRGTL